MKVTSLGEIHSKSKVITDTKFGGLEPPILISFSIIKIGIWFDYQNWNWN
jgi:hypothetical protein